MISVKINIASNCNFHLLPILGSVSNIGRCVQNCEGLIFGEYGRVWAFGGVGRVLVWGLWLCALWGV